jgi:purine-cytosine permease-like protein
MIRWGLTRLFNRRIGMSLLWCALIIGIAVLVNLVGISLIGGIEHWQRWLHSHAGLFLAWRMILYGATAWGWHWMRQRVLQREPLPLTRQRLLRIEIAAVAAIVLMEGSTWWQYGLR